MNTVAEQVASHLLQIKAIKLEPNHPFTWASGGNPRSIATTGKRCLTRRYVLISGINS